MAKKAIGTVLIEIGATTAKLQTEFGKATVLLKKFQKDTESMRKVVETAFAFKIGQGIFQGVNKLTSAVGELAKEGEKAQNLQVAFAALGGSIPVLEKAREATLGVVDAEGLMQAANKGLIASIPGFANSFDKVAELGTRLAQSIGVDAKQGIEQVTDAIITAKPTALRHVGIMLDTEAAAKKFAQAHGIAATQSGSFEKALSKTQKQTANMQAAMEGLNSAVNRFAPAIDSVTKAQTSLANTANDVLQTMQIQINNNPALIKAYRDLESGIKAIDFKALGDNLATITAWFVSMSSKYIPDFLNGISEVSRAFGAFFAIGKQGAADSIAIKMDAIQRQIDNTKKKLEQSDFSLSAQQKENLKNQLPLLEADLGKQKEAFKVAVAEINTYNKAADDAAAAARKLAEENKKSAKATHEVAAGIKAVSKEEKAALAFDKNENSVVLKRLQVNYSEALSQGNFTAAQDFLVQYKEAVNKAADLYAKEWASKGQDVSAAQLESYKQDFIRPATEDFVRAQKEAFQQSVTFFGGILDQLISGQSLDWEAMFKKVAVDFGSNILANLTSGFKLDVGNLGAQLADAIGMGPGSALNAALGSTSAAGVGPAAAGDVLGATVGGQAGAASFGGALGAAAGPYIGAAIGAFLIGKGVADLFKNKVDNSAQGVASRAQLGFSTGGLSEVSRLLGAGGGLFNHEDADTTGRNSILEFLKEKTGLGFSGSSGDRFKAGGGGFDFLKGLDSKANATFSALGEGLRSVLGITEDIGPQIGAILAENLNGNLEKAQELTASLGISQEELESAVIKSGLAMGKTFLEIQTMLNGVSDAFEAGRVGAGDLSGAITQLQATGNAGAQALQYLRDVAVEAGEKGAKSTQEFLNKLAELEDPTSVKAFSQVMQAFGIKTVDELAKVSDKAAIAILSMLQAVGFGFQAVGQNVEETSQKIQNLAIATGGLQLPPETAASITAYAKGGVVNHPSVFASRDGLGLMGEAGPEAIMPLTKVGGVLGVRAVGGGRNQGGANIFIDARGATPGVEHRIREAINDVRQDIIEEAVAAAERNSFLKESHG